VSRRLTSARLFPVPVPVEVMNPRGLVRSQPTSVDVLTDMARGLQIPEIGPEQSQPPPVRPVGPYATAEDTKFGHRFPVNIGGQQAIIQIEGKGAKETAACGLIVGYDLPDNTADVYAFPFARVLYGVAGGFDIFECDLLPGGIPCNMPSTAVRVDVFHPLVAAGIVGDILPAPQILAFAMLDVHGGLGRPGSSNPLRRTVFVAQVAGGGGVSNLIPIPRSAVAYQIGGRNAGIQAQLANVRVQQSVSVQTFAPVYETQGTAVNSPNIVGGAVPIAGGARALRVQNNDAGAVDPVIIFYLSL